MGLMCLVLGVALLATWIMGSADKAMIGSMALPGPSSIYLYAALALLALMVWFWRRGIWRGMRLVLDSIV